MGQARCSMTMTNKREERGQPCRVPFEISNGSKTVPCTNTEVEGWEYRDITLEIKAVPKPICSSESCRNLHSTLSNAFSGHCAEYISVRTEKN